MESEKATGVPVIYLTKHVMCKSIVATLLVLTVGMAHGMQLHAMQPQGTPQMLTDNKGAKKYSDNEFQAVALKNVLSVDLENVTLEQGLNTVARKAGLKLVYSTNIIPAHKHVSLQKSTATLENVLWALLAGTGLRFGVSSNNHLVIMKWAKEDKKPVQPMQAETVSGTVTDAQTGETLPGVNILVKGTSTGASTDADGQYELTVESLQDTLVVSFVGYQTQNVPINGRTVINIKMQSQAITGEEMVVVGYSKKQRKEITGSVSEVQGEELAETSETNITQTLQGKTAGVVINDRGGEPGNNNANFLIRGTGTLGNNSPLYVIDGVPRDEESFANLNSNDIESVSILKGASAAIYGARSANGVVLVTTKEGTAGKTEISINSNFGFQGISEFPPLMNSYQRAKYYNEWHQYQGLPPLWSEDALQHFKKGDKPVRYPNNNWKKKVIADYSPQTRHNISVSGGTENTQYYFSGAYLYQQGIYKSNDLNFKQAQLRARVNTQITNNLSVGINLQGRQGKRDAPEQQTSNTWQTLFQVYPWINGRWTNGKLGPGMNTGGSPITATNSDISGFRNNNRYLFNGKISITYDLPWITKGLQLAGYANFDYNKHFTKSFHNTYKIYDYDFSADTYTESDGYAFHTINSRYLNESNNFSLEQFYHLQLNYNHSFGKHNLSAFGAFEGSELNSDFFSAYRRDLPSDKKVQLFTGGENQKTNDGYGGVDGRVNYFGSLSYNYAQKYLLDFSLRYDGSFNFPKEKRFGLFPAVSAGWNIASEPFMDGTNEWLDNLKLRVGWAKEGNDRVPSFQYLNKYELGKAYYSFGTSPNARKIMTSVNTANPNITWENSYKTDIGIDMSIYRGLFSLTLDLFKDKRRDILTSRNAAVPNYTGLSLPDENIGKVDNKGIEISLNHDNNVGNISYNIGGNFTYHNNKVVYMAEAKDIPDYQKREGHPLNSWLLYKADGLFRTQSQVDDYPHMPGTQPGDIKYVDVNRDGEISGEDKIRIFSSPVPEVLFALNASVNYKNIGLNVFFQGQAKAKQFTKYTTDIHSTRIYFTERWTPENKQNSTYPRAYEKQTPINGARSTFWLYDAAYVRLKNVRLSYSLPASILSHSGMSQLEIYLSGRNLKTWDRMPAGWDPERPEGSGYYYPQMKKFIIGINLKF